MQRPTHPKAVIRHRKRNREQKSQMVQLLLPWFSNADGELNYSAMTLSEPGRVDRRKAFRIMRKWYKEQIGITVDKLTLERLWRRRHTTYAIDPNSVEDYIHELARETYEETVAESDLGSQEEAPSGAGV